MCSSLQNISYKTAQTDEPHKGYVNAQPCPLYFILVTFLALLSVSKINEPAAACKRRTALIFPLQYAPSILLVCCVVDVNVHFPVFTVTNGSQPISGLLVVLQGQL